MLDAERQINSLLTIQNVNLDSPFLFNNKNIQLYLDRAMDAIIHENSIFMEIGAFAGQSAKLWIDSLEASFLDCPLVIVDPYSPGAANNQDSYLVMERMLDIVKKYPSSSVYRLYSDDFFKIAKGLIIPYRDKKIPLPGNVSFALVDGDHTPAGEIRDIRSTAELLSEKAFVVVDDVHVALDEIRHTVEDVFKGSSAYLWTYGLTDIQQCYIWKGIEPPLDLLSQDEKLTKWL